MNRPPRTLLAVDTSTRALGVALYDGVQVLGEATWYTQDHHTRELASAVQRLMAQCGIQMDDLACVAVALGPGSFTGLRIGLALAKGICLVRGLPIVGIPTLDILAAGQPSAELPLAAVLRAGRGRLAVGWYRCQPAPADSFAGCAAINRRSWVSEREVEVLTAEALVERIQSPTLVAGELSEEERKLLGKKRPGAAPEYARGSTQRLISLASPSQSLRRPAFLAELAWQRWQHDRVDHPADLAPIYLHYHAPIPGEPVPA